MDQPVKVALVTTGVATGATGAGALTTAAAGAVLIV